MNRQMEGNLKGQNQAMGTRQTWNLRDTWNISLFVDMWADVSDCQKICWWDYYHCVPGVWQYGTLPWPIVFSKFTCHFFLTLFHVVHVCYTHLFPVYFSGFMMWTVLLFCKSYLSVLSACTNEIRSHEAPAFVHKREWNVLCTMQSPRAKCGWKIRFPTMWSNLDSAGYSLIPTNTTP